MDVTLADLWIVGLIAAYVAGWILAVGLSLRRQAPPSLKPPEDRPVLDDVPSLVPPHAPEGAPVEPAPVAEPAPAEPVPVAEPEPAPRSLEEGLGKTRKGFVSRLTSLLSGRKVDDDVLEELEEVLYTADLGVKTATKLLQALSEKMKRSEGGDADALRAILKTEVRGLLGEAPAAIDFGAAHPFVIMVVGVNGVGKTTTIGKLAQQLKEQGKSVIVAAADTFRAAAIDQLKIWGERAGVEVVAHGEGADPGAVAHDGVTAAKARNADVLIVDTAGRLHTRHNLMEELKKVHRVIAKALPGAPHEVLLVVDATTGQNALAQAQEFGNGVGVTSIALTKLDGTAKGGIVVGIRDETGVPVRWIGIGEGLHDLRPFDPDRFVDALFA